ncbi:MAG: ion transporter [Planctomycetota bacterium]
MPRLRQIVDESDTALGRTFDAACQVLIVISLAALAFETLPGLSDRSRVVLKAIEWISLSLFSIEYVVRLLAASNKARYATSFYGVIDLAAIAPSLIGVGFDLRSIRALRLLRVFRVLKLARYSDAIQRVNIALRLAREELVLFGAVTLVVLFLAAVGIYEFEHQAQPEVFASIFHSLWWAVVTLTTVGYGDAYPVTVGGRAFTLVVLLVGLGIVSIPPGLIASALSKAREIQQQERC